MTPIEQALYRLACEDKGMLTLTLCAIAAADTVEAVPSGRGRKAATNYAIRVAEYLNGQRGLKPSSAARSFSEFEQRAVWEAVKEMTSLWRSLLERWGSPGSVILPPSFVCDTFADALPAPEIGALGPLSRPSALA
jgi:hypothetical protein